jgi:hypothetical protein
MRFASATISSVLLFGFCGESADNRAARGSDQSHKEATVRKQTVASLSISKL